jgi:hypothetical protein
VNTSLNIAAVNRRNGSAVIVVIALVALLLVFVTANLRSISNFGHELKLLEQRQTRHLPHARATTNTISSAKGAKTNSR